MVSSAKDVPGLKILNSNVGENNVANSSVSGQNSSNNIVSGNTHKAKKVVTYENGNMTSSSNSLK